MLLIRCHFLNLDSIVSNGLVLNDASFVFGSNITLWNHLKFMESSLLPSQLSLCVLREVVSTPKLPVPLYIYPY